jgi:DNA-binding protein H-NS
MCIRVSHSGCTATRENPAINACAVEQLGDRPVNNHIHGSGGPEPFIARITKDRRMAKTLQQIEQQIAQLQQRAQALRVKASEGAVASIRQLMAEHGLSMEDLVALLSKQPEARAAKSRTAAAGQARSAKASKPRKGAAKTKAATALTKKLSRSAVKPEAGKSGVQASGQVGVIMYRDEAGHAWTGRGTKPKWFVAALAAGKTPQDLRVNAPVA